MAWKLEDECRPSTYCIIEINQNTVISSVWLQGNDKTQSCISNKKTSEKSNNYINKQETKGSNNCVGEYKNVCEIEMKMFAVALTGTSKIYEIWCVLNGGENREIKRSNICVDRGEWQTYAVNQSLRRQGKRNVGVEKVECRWGGGSRVMRLPSKVAIRRLRRIYVMLNVGGVTVDVLPSRSQSRLPF